MAPHTNRLGKGRVRGCNSKAAFGAIGLASQWGGSPRWSLCCGSPAGCVEGDCMVFAPLLGCLALSGEREKPARPQPISPLWGEHKKTRDDLAKKCSCTLSVGAALGSCSKLVCQQALQVLTLCCKPPSTKTGQCFSAIYSKLRLRVLAFNQTHPNCSSLLIPGLPNG